MDGDSSRYTLNRNLITAVAGSGLLSGIQLGYILALSSSWTATVTILALIPESHRRLMPGSYSHGYSWYQHSSTVINATYLSGAVFGGLLAGLLAARFGRKRTLLASNGLPVVCLALQLLGSVAGSYQLMLLARLVLGLHAGLVSGVAPMYACEAAPVRWRGAAGSSFFLGIVAGGLPGGVITSALDTRTRTDVFETFNWVLAMGLVLVPCVIQLVVLVFFCPESPVHLIVEEGLERKAKAASIWLQGGAFSSVTEDSPVPVPPKSPPLKLCDLFTIAPLRLRLLIACVLMIGQQLTGINAVFFYSLSLFISATGMGPHTALYINTGLNCVTLLMTLVSLLLVDRDSDRVACGRKRLLLTGFTGMLIGIVLLYVSIHFRYSANVNWMNFVGCFALVVFMAGFGLGPGPIAWFAVAELSTDEARPYATSIAVAVNYIANWVVAVGFIPLVQAIGAHVFLVYAIVLGNVLAFTWILVPEMTGKPAGH